MLGKILILIGFLLIIVGFLAFLSNPPQTDQGIDSLLGKIAFDVSLAIAGIVLLIIGIKREKKDNRSF